MKSTNGSKVQLMYAELDSVKIKFEYLREHIPHQPYILLLHGFTGSLEDWLDFEKFFPPNFNLVGMDFIGHGTSDSPENVYYYSTESIVRQIKKVKEAVTGTKIFLLGYSMGGRAAINYTLQFPYDISGLILESSSAGISNPSLRFERERTDRDLAEFILSNPIDSFLDDWMSKEIFNTQKFLPEKILNDIRNRKLNSCRTGLANSLLGFGTAVMEPVLDKLPLIRIPVQLICGELDRKFVQINQQMQKLLPNSKIAVISGAGHNVHLEETKKYADIVYSFVGSF